MNKLNARLVLAAVVSTVLLAGCGVAAAALLTPSRQVRRKA